MLRTPGFSHASFTLSGQWLEPTPSPKRRPISMPSSSIHSRKIANSSSRIGTVRFEFSELERPNSWSPSVAKRTDCSTCALSTLIEPQSLVEEIRSGTSSATTSLGRSPAQPVTAFKPRACATLGCGSEHARSPLRAPRLRSRRLIPSCRPARPSSSLPSSPAAGQRA